MLKHKHGAAANKIAIQMKKFGVVHKSKCRSQGVHAVHPEVTNILVVYQCGCTLTVANPNNGNGAQT